MFKRVSKDMLLTSLPIPTLENLVNTSKFCCTHKVTVMLTSSTVFAHVSQCLTEVCFSKNVSDHIASASTLSSRHDCCHKCVMLRNAIRNLIYIIGKLFYL